MLVGQLRDQHKKENFHEFPTICSNNYFPLRATVVVDAFCPFSILFFAWVHSYYMHLLKVNRRHFTGTFGCPKSTSLGYGVRLVYIGKGSYCNIGKPG